MRQSLQLRSCAAKRRGSAMPDALRTAANDAVNSACVPLSYIRELSDLLADTAEEHNPNRIQALAAAVASLAGQTERILEKLHQEART